MMRNFFSTPNILGRLLIVLLFVGGIVYGGAFDGFVVEIEASSCCGGGTDASVLSGDATEISAAEYKCSRKPSGSNQKYCKTSNGTNTRRCTHDCSGPGNRGNCNIPGC